MSDPNGIIMQAFHAYIPDLEQHLQHLQEQAKALAQTGFTAVWLPRISTLRQQEAPAASNAQALEAQYRQTVITLRSEGMQVYSELPSELPNQLTDRLEVDGFCLDAELSSDLRTQVLQQLPISESSLFVMNEYWTEKVENLHQYIQETQGQLSLLDVPLHFNFYRASRAGGYYDMSKLLDNTLIQQQSALAVTFVESHRSQPLQPPTTLPESVVEPWFKPLAYAIILLRREGYPCLFYPDYYGAHYCAQGRDGKEHEIWLNSHRWLLDKFLYARQQYAYGRQIDYFDQPCVVGWTRWGTATYPKTMAVIMSDGWGGSKWMELGRPHAAYYDLTEHIQGTVYTNADGWGEFYCRSGSVSVWLEE